MLGCILRLYLILHIFICLLQLCSIFPVLLGHVERSLIISLQNFQFLVALLLQGQFLLYLSLLHYLRQGILVSLFYCHLLIKMSLLSSPEVRLLFLLERFLLCAISNSDILRLLAIRGFDGEDVGGMLGLQSLHGEVVLILRHLLLRESHFPVVHILLVILVGCIDICLSVF